MSAVPFPAALRAIVAALAAAVAALCLAPAQAHALTPEQAYVKPTIDLTYWDLDRFWIPSRRPTVDYYNYYSGGRLIDVNAACGGSTADDHGTQGFYCDGGWIYIDYNQQAGNLARFGDGAVAFWLAHEYAHHVEWLLGINWTRSAPYHELLADCFAGMYFRYGTYTSRRLSGNDYQQARNQIWALSPSALHGTRVQRLRAFDFGFTQTAWRGCVNAAGTSY